MTEILFTAGSEGPRFKLRFFRDVVPYDTGADLISGVLMPGGLSAIVGATGTRKTFLALHTAMCVARGVPWFGREVKQGPALYVAAEAQESFANRLMAYKIANGLDDETVPFADIAQRPNILNPADVSGLIESIEIAGADFEAPVSFICIDTLAAVTPGAEENSAADMTKAMDALLSIKEKTGAAVCFVHHTGKDESRGARGHSSLKAALDTMITVSADPVSAFSIASMEKQRDMEAGDDFTFGLDVVEILTRENGTVLTSCVVRQLDTMPKRVKLSPKLRRALGSLENLVADHGESAPDAKHYPAGAQVVAVETWRENLVMAGIIDEQGKNPRQQWKYLRDVLAERGAIAEWNGRVWIVRT